MSHFSIFSLVPTEAKAAEALGQLKAAGFCNDDFAAVLPDKTGTRDLGFIRRSKAFQGVVLGGLVGGLTGATLGAVAAFDVFPSPAMLPLEAAGPIFAALSSGAVGFGFGALLGLLVGLTRPEFVAQRYRGKIRESNILLSVHCDTRKAARRARRILRHAGVRAVGRRAREMDVRPRRNPAQPELVVASAEALKI